MSTYLPVGTIIDINGVEAMIVGYDNHESGNALTDGYLIVKSPIGFTGESSVAFIETTGNYKVVEVGYQYDEANEYLTAQKELFDQIAELGADAAFKMFDEVAQTVIGKGK